LGFRTRIILDFPLISRTVRMLFQFYKDRLSLELCHFKTKKYHFYKKKILKEKIQDMGVLEDKESYSSLAWRNVNSIEMMVIFTYGCLTLWLSNYIIILLGYGLIVDLDNVTLYYSRWLR
jgi:hypothetical protein